MIMAAFKRFITILFAQITILPFLFSSSISAAQPFVSAIPSASKILLDGYEKQLTAYNIYDNNYFKLRDVAFMLSGTEKRFSVTWNEKDETVSVITGEYYLPVGGEMEQITDPSPRNALPAANVIYINGVRAEFNAYLISDNNYIKLRDLGEILNFGVDWRAEDNAVLISSQNNYYDANPVSPWKYQEILEKGLDVDWAKTQDGRKYYCTQTAQDFWDAGINHVRIRIKDKADDELFASLDKQIDDCIKLGIIPIIAYQADEFKNSPSEETIQKVVDWWSAVAQRYRHKSYLLSFDLIIEVTDELNKQPEKLNEIYDKIVTEVRKTNSKRIIMISPRLRSDPAYLNELEIPAQHNGYLMAEWHFYASGPSKTNEKKLWITGSAAEKQLILDKINLALAWQEKTNIPTWVGAWMPGNYNETNDYTIEEQCIFASFVSSALSNANIPFAVNSDTKFYNRETGEWFSEMKPVFESIF